MEKQECQSPFCAWENPLKWPLGQWGAVLFNMCKGIGLVWTYGKKETGEGVRVCPEALGVCWHSPVGVLSWRQKTASVLTAVELYGYGYMYIWCIIYNLFLYNIYNALYVCMCIRVYKKFEMHLSLYVYICIHWSAYY